MQHHPGIGSLSRHMQHAYVAVNTPNKNQPRNVWVYLNSSAKEYLQTFQSKATLNVKFPFLHFHLGVVQKRVESWPTNKPWGHDMKLEKHNSGASRREFAAFSSHRRSAVTGSWWVQGVDPDFGRASKLGTQWCIQWYPFWEFTVYSYYWYLCRTVWYDICPVELLRSRLNS